VFSPSNHMGRTVAEIPAAGTHATVIFGGEWELSNGAVLVGISSRVLVSRPGNVVIDVGEDTFVDLFGLDDQLERPGHVQL